MAFFFQHLFLFWSRFFFFFSVVALSLQLFSFDFPRSEGIVCGVLCAFLKFYHNLSSYINQSEPTCRCALSSFNANNACNARMIHRNRKEKKRHRRNNSSSSSDGDHSTNWKTILNMRLDCYIIRLYECNHNQNANWQIKTFWWEKFSRNKSIGIAIGMPKMPCVFFSAFEIYLGWRMEYTMKKRIQNDAQWKWIPL